VTAAGIWDEPAPLLPAGAIFPHIIVLTGVVY